MDMYEIDKFWLPIVDMYDRYDYLSNDSNITFHVIMSMHSMGHWDKVSVKIQLNHDIRTEYIKRYFKNHITEELIMVAMHPDRIQRHLSFYEDEIEIALENL